MEDRVVNAVGVAEVIGSVGIAVTEVEIFVTDVDVSTPVVAGAEGLEMSEGGVTPMILVPVQ